MFSNKYRLISFLCVALILVSGRANSNLGIPLEDSTQSIHYWKPHVIAIDKDTKVAVAHEVFMQLKRTWNSTRVEPQLYVIASANGPWAASLDDGSILLSKNAIEICYNASKEHYRDLIAFILAHELAHQHNEHLWHRKFFRLAEQLVHSERRDMFSGLSALSITPEDIEKKEIQADRDALVTMAMVNFDPFMVVENKSFFEIWVENIWGQNCAELQSTSANHSACKKAKARALRARTRLQELSIQLTLFELGKQYYVAGNYRESQRYFLAFGREFPGRSIHSNIGLSLLQQAIKTKSQLHALGTINEPELHYPLILAASPQFLTAKKRAIGNHSDKRSVVEKLRVEFQRSAENAIEAFEKAAKITPSHKQNYIHLASAYLLAGNIPMAKGIIEGKYQMKFGKDLYSKSLSSLTTALDGDTNKALNQLTALLELTKNSETRQDNNNIVLTSIYYNIASLHQFHGKTDQAKSILKKLAYNAQKSGDPALFQMSLLNLGKVSQRTVKAEKSELEQVTIGENIKKQFIEKHQGTLNQFRIDGIKLNYVHFADSSNLVINDSGEILASWQYRGRKSLTERIKIGSHVNNLLKTIGAPNRRIFSEELEYYAYDNNRIAFAVSDNVIYGWFHYPSGMP